jgi:hypothetical protein
VQEKRSHPRVPVEMTVSCEVAGRAPITGVGRDISLGGMFIESNDPPPPFATEITIVGRVPGMHADARLPAVVRWTKPGGIGVQFGLLGAKETHAIARLMRG